MYTQQLLLMDYESTRSQTDEAKIQHTTKRFEHCPMNVVQHLFHVF